MSDLRPAVFIDRDGTINIDTGYVSRAEDVALVEGAARAIARLNAAKVPVVVVTNQSGIGRGMFTAADFEIVGKRLSELLAAKGAHVDATYHCPHAPEVECECRKPGTLLFRRAAEELKLDTARSWFIGDRLRDIEPAAAFKAHGVLVPRLHTPSADVVAAGERFIVATTLDAAVTRVLDAMRAPLTGGRDAR